MLTIILIAEGLGLGFLLYLICTIGICTGAVRMVHLYDTKLQDRVVQLGLTTAEEIRKRSLHFKSASLDIYFTCSCAYMSLTARAAFGPAFGRAL